MQLVSVCPRPLPSHMAGCKAEKDAKVHRPVEKHGLAGMPLWVVAHGPHIQAGWTEGLLQLWWWVWVGPYRDFSRCFPPALTRTGRTVVIPGVSGSGSVTEVMDSQSCKSCPVVEPLGLGWL